MHARSAAVEAGEEDGQHTHQIQDYKENKFNILDLKKPVFLKLVKTIETKTWNKLETSQGKYTFFRKSTRARQKIPSNFYTFISSDRIYLVFAIGALKNYFFCKYLKIDLNCFWLWWKSIKLCTCGTCVLKNNFIFSFSQMEIPYKLATINVRRSGANCFQ